MYKNLFQQQKGHGNIIEEISKYEINEIEELMKSVEKTRASITKTMSRENVSKIKQFKENQKILRKKVEEKLNNTIVEDEDDDSDDRKEKFMDKVRQFIANNITDSLENLELIDRNLMINYLKLEQNRILKSKLIAIKTVKMAIEAHHDLK